MANEIRLTENSERGEVIKHKMIPVVEKYLCVNVRKCTSFYKDSVLGQRV